MTRFTAIFALTTVAICAMGCNRTADEKPSTTQTSSAELDPANVTESSANDYESMVHREQITLQARVDDEMTSVDHQLSELRRAGKINGPDARALVARRETLEADRAVVAKSDERGWDELKATVEHDLEEP